MSILEQRGQRLIGQLDQISKNQRNGLFSQPLSTNIGDQYKEQKLSQGPRNIMTNPHLKSTGTPSLFQPPQFITINDPYKESFKMQQIMDKRRIDQIPNNESFKYTGNMKKVYLKSVNSEFQHLKEYDNKVYNTRNPDGTVRLQPKNFYSPPGKKGSGYANVGHTFQNISYQIDPYESKQIMQQKESAYQKGLQISNQPFNSTYRSRSPFVDNKTTYVKICFDELQKKINKNQSKIFFTYGEKFKINEQRTRSVDNSQNGTIQQRPWKYSSPAKQGYNKTLEKFPIYIEQGDGRNVKFVKPDLNQSKKWNPNSNGTYKQPFQTITTGSLRTQQVLKSIK